MAKFCKGDKVISNTDIIRGKNKVLSKDIMGVVNDVYQTTCDCTTINNTWSFIWLGYSTDNGTDLYRVICSKCHKVVVSDTKRWYQTQNFDKIESSNESIAKYAAQVELLKLLANNTISGEVYKKIMAYTEGDEEMLELGKQLLKEVKNV